MFRRLSTSLPKDPEFPPYLEALGYYVTENDQIRSMANPDKEFNFFISKNERVNEMQREAMNICIRKIVLERLAASGLDTVRVPLRASNDEPHIPILVSSDIVKKQRVIVVLGESVQDLGIWAYRTVGQKSINEGSAVDFVHDVQRHITPTKSSASNDVATGEAPGIVIANPGQLVWYRGGRRPMTLRTWQALPRRSAVHMPMRLDMVKNRVPGNEDSERHVEYLFRKVLPELLKKDAAVDVIGIGDGATEAVKFLDANWSTWSSRISAIALGAPGHTVDELTNEAFAEFLSKRGRAYIISSEPLDTPLSGREMYGCNCYASGVSYFTEEVMQNVYKPMLDYFQLIADVPGYEEVECFVAVPADGEDDVPAEEVQTGGDKTSKNISSFSCTTPHRNDACFSPNTSGVPPIRLQARRLQPQHPWTAVRAFSTSRLYQNHSKPVQTSDEDVPPPKSAEEMEGVVRLARQTYGESLPDHLLSSEEYSIYERLYGPPLRAEDVHSLEDLEEDDESNGVEDARNILLRENSEGDLEEVEYHDVTVGLQTDALSHENGNDTLVDTPRRLHNDSDTVLDSELRQEEPSGVLQTTGQLDQVLVDEYDEVQEDYEAEEDSENIDDLDEDAESTRAHPYTIAGRFSTSPSTIYLPRKSFVDPVTSMLADFSNKHLSEVAQRTFGGPDLPYSTATPTSKQRTEQKPIALGASQIRMGEMEGNSYMAAVMPGAYVAVMSTLVEVRKRLGSDWIENLLKKEGGPRVLDAGAGGAGIVAWREVLQAEWKRMQPEGSEKPVPLGKATVVTGSSTLRHRSSRLLENTTFLPRLPDYVHVRHEPTFGDNAPPPQRKQFDVVLAPHTLWPLKEDYMRKQSVQNLWSLLNPNGGVLVLIEKGLPRGFEMIAAARETILEKYISSPGSSMLENDIEDPTGERYTKKEPGMIIAPCTNHTSCPMYLTPGKSTARKDFCYFKQRYVRPPYLQRILGVKDQNHEDVQFSYVAFRRGRDERESRGLVQGDQATDAAFFGYEQAEMSLPNLTADVADPKTPRINTLGLPRAILPPIKRHGHVTLDLCTPAGRIERWTVPRSFSKQAYRDARKSKWGDLWALGAKTRVQRNIRIGRNPGSKKPKGKNVFEIDVGEQGMEDVRQVTGGRVKTEKRTKEGRKERKQKKISLDEF